MGRVCVCVWAVGGGREGVLCIIKHAFNWHYKTIICHALIAFAN